MKNNFFRVYTVEYFFYGDVPDLVKTGYQLFEPNFNKEGNRIAQIFLCVPKKNLSALPLCPTKSSGYKRFEANNPQEIGFTVDTIAEIRDIVGQSTQFSSRFC